MSQADRNRHIPHDPPFRPLPTPHSHLPPALHTIHLLLHLRYRRFLVVPSHRAKIGVESRPAITRLVIVPPQKQPPILNSNLLTYPHLPLAQLTTRDQVLQAMINRHTIILFHPRLDHHLLPRTPQHSRLQAILFSHDRSLDFPAIHILPQMITSLIRLSTASLVTRHLNSLLKRVWRMKY